MSDIQRPTSEAASNGGGVSSPQSRRRSLTPAWASVVRGDSEQNLSPTAASASAAASPVSYSSPTPAGQASALDNPMIESSGSEAQPKTSDANSDSNADQQRMPAWNRPLNRVVESTSVMGGSVSWPALSETTRSFPRSSSDSHRFMSDATASSSQAPTISSPPHQPVNNNAHGNFTANNPLTRQRSRNRNGGGVNSSVSGQSQPVFNQPSLPMPPPFPVFEVPYGMIPAAMDTSVRGLRPVGGSQSHAGNSHSNQRSYNNRRGGYGSRPRGDGQYHNNHGGRRDHDRRELHHLPQYEYAPPPMGYMPSPLPPGATPFVAPPPMRIFPGHMGFDVSSPFIYVQPMPMESFRAMPLVPSHPPMLVSPTTNETSLANMIVNQIDFYFSYDNLVKDNFLRSNMDDQGWVPISLIASFPRVQQLTKDIPVILDSLRNSTVVEVQGEKLRRRNEWSKWVHSFGRQNSDSGSIASSSAHEGALASSVHAVTLDDTPANADGDVNAAQGDHVNGLTGGTVLGNGEKSGDEVRSITV